MVETVHGEGDVPFGDGIETHLFWEELSDEAVHVLVGATLPGGVGMGKEEMGVMFCAWNECHVAVRAKGGGREDASGQSGARRKPFVHAADNIGGSAVDSSDFG